MSVPFLMGLFCGIPVPFACQVCCSLAHGSVNEGIGHIQECPELCAPWISPQCSWGRTEIPIFIANWQCGWVPHSALELALDGNAAAEPCSLGTAQSPPCALLPPSLCCGCAALQAVCCSIRPFVQECLFGFHAGRVTLP